MSGPLLGIECGPSARGVAIPTTLSRIPFYPDAGSNRFFRNLCTCQPNYTASHPGRPVLLLTAVRTANLSVKCRHVIKLTEMLRALKDAETR
jgi:hypothetical protein